jgi:hypothetical protein
MSNDSDEQTACGLAAFIQGAELIPDYIRAPPELP